MIHSDSLDVCYEGYIFRLQLLASNDIEASVLAAEAGKFMNINMFYPYHHFKIFVCNFFLSAELNLNTVHLL